MVQPGHVHQQQAADRSQSQIESVGAEDLFSDCSIHVYPSLFLSSSDSHLRSGLLNPLPIEAEADHAGRQPAEDRYLRYDPDAQRNAEWLTAGR